jgi:dTDP-4-amino-4,6-dideoxygalactose transaminase
MIVPLLDLKTQYATIKAQVHSAIAEVLESQHFILGLESSVKRPSAQYSECSRAIGVSSGSDALLACLIAENIGRGDEVISTPYKFFATAARLLA